MANGPLDVAAVTNALADFRDPELGRGVVEMEQVRDISVEGDAVRLTLELTSFSAPLWEETKAAAETHLRGKLPSVGSIHIDIAEHHRPAQPQGELGLTAKAVIAVGSGKGGVGKSTIATALAYGLKRQGCKVGILDADVYGPSVPHLMGTELTRPEIIENKIQPIVKDGIPLMSMGYLTPPGEAVIWRGPMLHGALTQFLRDTQWGDLDYLLIDMPPGTGDIALTLSQQIQPRGAVVVCTPQDVALLDAVKAIAMFNKVNIPMLGMVENMSGFTCPNCNEHHDIFGSGGAKRRAAELNVPFLGEVPLNMQVRINGDAGSMASVFDDPIVAAPLEQIVHTMVSSIAAENAAEPPLPSLNVL
jgi:ATP-binding protein involved in chromosome partitioning